MGDGGDAVIVDGMLAVPGDTTLRAIADSYAGRVERVESVGAMVRDIPAGAMRVGPNTDAVVWNICLIDKSGL